MKRYAIWDKVSPIFTPSGAVFTAEQWIDKYPIAGFDSVTIVCAAGELNGGFFGTLTGMKEMYENEGCDFSTCTTDEEVLDAIEAFEDEMNAPSEEASAEERIAAALEYQNLMAE